MQVPAGFFFQLSPPFPKRDMSKHFEEKNSDRTERALSRRSVGKTFRQGVVTYIILLHSYVVVVVVVASKDPNTSV